MADCGDPYGRTQCLTLCLICLTLSQASSGATLERQGGDPPVSIVAVLRARPAKQAPTGGGGTVPLVPWGRYPGDGYPGDDAHSAQAALPLAPWELYP